MSKRLYLETTILRSRLIGHSSIRHFLAEKLKNQTRITSEFVRMEFNRSFICNLIEFYFNLQNQNSIDDAIRWWNENYQTRKIKDINFIVDKLFIGIDDRQDIKRALANLRNEIKKIITLFNCLIHRLEKNNTRCYFTEVKLDFESCVTVEELESTLVKFYKAYRDNYVDKCNIIAFFNESKETLRRIIEYESKESGFLNQKDKLNEIVHSGKKLTCKVCCNVGDTIIALECPDYAILLSTDKAFEDLCKIMGLKYEIIDSLRAIHPSKEILKKLN